MTKTMLVCMVLAMLLTTSFTPGSVTKTSPLKARFASVTVTGPAALVCAIRAFGMPM